MPALKSNIRSTDYFPKPKVNLINHSLVESSQLLCKDIKKISSKYAINKGLQNEILTSGKSLSKTENLMLKSLESGFESIVHNNFLKTKNDLLELTSFKTKQKNSMLENPFIASKKTNKVDAKVNKVSLENTMLKEYDLKVKSLLSSNRLTQIKGFDSAMGTVADINLAQLGAKTDQSFSPVSVVKLYNFSFH